ncbi:MAG: class I SAM-dependent methyltransferase, partial [Bacteroidales bacterium]|nr:class I SAM-dependent methyltransferase [Bacteroidales bacterium]
SQMAFNDNEFELGIISFALHEKPGEIARKIVQEAFRVIKPGGYLLVIDYMLDKSVKPSTRMAIHLVERMAGRDHYRCFRDYHRYGGLDALLPSDRIKEEHRFHSGGIRLRLYSYSVGKTTPGN